MKSNRFCILTVMLLMSLTTMAQYKFTIDGGFSGDCAKVSGVRELNQQLQQIKGQVVSGFPDPSSCENARAIINSIKAQAEMIVYDARTGKTIDRKKYNCHFKLNASPCTGRPLGGTNVGTPNVLGVSQGTSFYSTNTANEIHNWSEDDMERMLALDHNYQPLENKAIATGDVDFDRTRSSLPVIDPDKPFRSLNVDENLGSNDHSADLSMRDGFNKLEMANDFSLLANKENVQRYVDASQGLLAPYLANPQDLTQLLHNDFRIVSGFDVDAIMQKLPSERTDAEKQALIDYQEYRKAVTENMTKDLDKYVAKMEETKEFEMAVLSEDCYGDSKHEFILQTNYKKVDINDYSIDDPIRNLAETIEKCNGTNSETGFHAVLYKNEITNEYTIAFEGSNFHPLTSTSDFINDWCKTNLKQGLGDIPEQYVLAAYIGSMIPSGVNVNITGHSLGGGLASVAGAISGCKTYTFNAEGVNKKVMDTFDINNNEKVENIKAFQANNDMLSSVQEGIGRPVAKAGMTTLAPPISIVVGSIAMFKDVASPSIGNKEIVNSGGWHKLPPMVRYFSNKQQEARGKYGTIRQEIYEKGHGIEYQTQESIQIFTGK